MKKSNLFILLGIILFFALFVGSILYISNLNYDRESSSKKYISFNKPQSLILTKGTYHAVFQTNKHYLYTPIYTDYYNEGNSNSIINYLKVNITGQNYTLSTDSLYTFCYQHHDEEKNICFKKYIIPKTARYTVTVTPLHKLDKTASFYLVYED